MNIVGIDPGLSGGICAIRRGTIIFLEPCPVVMLSKKRDYDVTKMVEAMKALTPCKVYIEKVHAFPGQGTTSMFNFGRGYGIWIGIATALGCEIHYVSPQQWKKTMLRDTDKSKGAAILKAKELAPGIDLKPTDRSKKDSDGLAEAFLIAKYGEMQQ